MYSALDRLLKLTKQLFPTGRAFRVSDNSTKEKVTKALLYSEERFYNDSVGILNSILPDNDFFTAEDATRWEERLGMIIGIGVPLQDRKDAIIRKMNHPGTVLARQSAGYLQNQLQLAGFDVYVYENIPAQTPESVLIDANNAPNQLGGFQLNNQQLGNVYSVNPDLFTAFQLNDFQLGSQQLNSIIYNNLIVNNIIEANDFAFNYGTLRRTFFIGGNPLGTFSNVLASRKDEFRQLILKIKPAQTVGFLFVNYV